MGADIRKGGEAGKSSVSRSRMVGGRRFQAFTGGVDVVIALGIMVASFLV
jgi:hypothetical protein